MPLAMIRSFLFGSAGKNSAQGRRVARSGGPGARSWSAGVRGGGLGAQIARAVGTAGVTVLAHCNTDAGGARAALAGLPPERAHALVADATDPVAMGRLWRDALSLPPASTAWC
jgi:NAD(P)-dependent dehydrogenase (short-subunit alcohol dehydrogenase family)